MLVLIDCGAFRDLHIICILESITWSNSSHMALQGANLIFYVEINHGNNVPRREGFSMYDGYLGPLDLFPSQHPSNREDVVEGSTGMWLNIEWLLTDFPNWL